MVLSAAQRRHQRNARHRDTVGAGPPTSISGEVAAFFHGVAKVDFKPLAVLRRTFKPPGSADRSRRKGRRVGPATEVSEPPGVAAERKARQAADRAILKARL
jgi:hypothetical protein